MKKQTTLTLRLGRLRLELDLDEVIPDDPGAGTPALVCADTARGEVTGTYWCAKETGELTSGLETTDLTPREIAWLNRADVEDQVNAFLYGEPAPADGPPYDAATATGMYDRDC